MKALGVQATTGFGVQRRAHVIGQGGRKENSEDRRSCCQQGGDLIWFGCRPGLHVHEARLGPELGSFISNCPSNQLWNSVNGKVFAFPSSSSAPVLFSTTQ